MEGAVTDIKFDVEGGGDILEVIVDIILGDLLFIDEDLVVNEVKDEESGVVRDGMVVVVEVLEVPEEDTVWVVPFGEVLGDEGGCVCHTFWDEPLVFVYIAEESEVVTLEVVDKFFAFKAVSDSGFDETDASVVECDFVLDVRWGLE